jgi:hypothetical protein
MDRAYAQPLDVPALARIAHVSEAHLHGAVGLPQEEHRPLHPAALQIAVRGLAERGPERAGDPGTFSRTFRDIVGRSPREYREQAVTVAVPTCFAKAWMRPSH